MDGFLDPRLREAKLELAYPCRWSFKVIGEDEYRMRLAVAAVVGAVDYDLSLSNTSRTGRWRSLLLTLTVTSDEERHAIGERLHRHDDVRMVL